MMLARFEERIVLFASVSYSYSSTRKYCYCICVDDQINGAVREEGSEEGEQVVEENLRLTTDKFISNLATEFQGSLS